MSAIGRIGRLWRRLTLPYRRRRYLRRQLPTDRGVFYITDPGRTGQ